MAAAPLTPPSPPPSTGGAILRSLASGFSDLVSATATAVAQLFAVQTNLGAARGDAPELKSEKLPGDQVGAVVELELHQLCTRS